MACIPLTCMIINIFFFNDTATTEIYTLSLHDALPICPGAGDLLQRPQADLPDQRVGVAEQLQEQRLVVGAGAPGQLLRSEEHTSELQSRQYLVCRLLLEKKKRETYETEIRV